MLRQVSVCGTLALALTVGVPRATLARQVPPPPPPPGSGQVGPAASAGGANLEQLSGRMAGAIRDLADGLAAAAGQTPQGGYLERDARELQQGIDDWFTATRGARDPAQLRRTYSGLDVSWHRLRGQLEAPGVAGPAFLERARRVDQAEGQLRQALGMNDYPPGIDGPAVAPAGVDETRGLAYALAQRGEALAQTIAAVDAPDPGLAPLVRDAADLARMADNFHDALGDPARMGQPDFARTAFSQIVQRSNGFGVNLAATPMPPAVRQAWDGYTSAHNLLRVNLGLTASTPNGLPPAFNPIPAGNPPPVAVALPYVATPTAPVAGWADQLAGQVDDLLAHFGPTANVVPGGRFMLGDIERLRVAALGFRQDAARGLGPGQLAFEFREVDATWRRLARRFARVARGRTGPNINQVQVIGQTCNQIHQALGMPGAPPGFDPF